MHIYIYIYIYKAWKPFELCVCVLLKQKDQKYIFE